MRLLTLLICFLSFQFVLAQKHDNIWMNGNFYKFYIDFNSFPPSLYPINSDYTFLRTMAFMNDSEGNPLFYSNGCTLQNANHEQMENGDSLLQNDYFCVTNGYMNLAHSAGLTLPYFTPNYYIRFSISAGYPLPAAPCETTRLVAHYIDMSANQGLGKVTAKEELILEGCFQEPTANRHANGRDWWILLPDNQESRFFRWLLTPSGLVGPWEQVVENPTVDGYSYCGWSEFSPDGSRYLINSCKIGVVTYNFDRCTGELSNGIFLERNTAWNNGATFSPDSKLLYTVDSISTKLIQYDLTAPDVNASKELIAVWDGGVDSWQNPTVFGFMQYGPDGKLYIWGGGSHYMHLVDFPNRRGTACSLRQRAIELLGTSKGASIYFPRYRLGPIDGSSCDTLGINNHPSALFRYDLEDTLAPLQVTFTDASSYEPTSWHWDFGDGAMSQDTNPVHAYAQSGTYNVCLIAANAFAADTFCRWVTVGTTGVHELPVLPHISVSPNPFSQEIRVQLPAQLSVEPQFVLSDLYGRTIARLTLRDFETTVSVPDLPNGVYVWQLFWKGVQTQQGKVVKVE